MKSGRLEFFIHVACWCTYTCLAVFGRGEYWNEMAPANVVMAFVSFPAAFFSNAFWFFPHFFNRKRWGWYGIALIAGYLCLETARVIWIALDPDSPGFRETFMGAHDVFTVVFFGYLVSFVYAAVQNWRVQTREIEQLKKMHPAVAPALDRDSGKPDTADNRHSPGFFFVQTGNARKRIAGDDILYISGEGNYVYYVTAAEKVLVRKSIREVLQTLPASGFIQIHRSYIVALARIEKIQDNHVYIAGERLPVGSTYREVFFQTIESLQR